MIRLYGLALGLLLVALPCLGQPVGAQGVTCSSFPSQAAAQAAYRNDPAGLANLDADGDGIACESNGAPFDQTPVSRPAAPSAQPAQPSAPAPTAQQTQSGPRPPTPGPAGTVYWARGYPQMGTSGCIEYVAAWSDGTFSSTPWDCGPGVIARMGTATASRGYPQIAANGCTEYVTQWSNGTFTWVPFECPPGVVYFKPVGAGPAVGATDTLVPADPGPPAALPPAPLPPAPTAPTAPLPTLPPLQPVSPSPAPAAPAAGSPAGLREYVVQREGFAIAIPTNWVRVDPRETGLTDLPPEVFALFKFVAGDVSDDASLAVIKGAIGGPNSIQAIFERNRPTTSGGSTTRTTEISEEEITLPAGRALKTVSDVTVTRANGQTFTYRNVAYFIPTGDQLYILDFDCEVAAYGRFAPIFDQIARSLRFI